MDAEVLLRIAVLTAAPDFGEEIVVGEGLAGLCGEGFEEAPFRGGQVNGGAVGGYQGILFTRDPRLPEPTLDRRSITDDLPVNGVYRAGSDHRKDGQAAGW